MAASNEHAEHFCTHDEIAAELGVTRQRVQQLERRALAKCRRECERRGLALADLVPACDERHEPDRLEGESLP